MTDILEADLEGCLPSKSFTSEPQNFTALDEHSETEAPDKGTDVDDLEENLAGEQAHLKETSLLLYLKKRPKLVSC